MDAPGPRLKKITNILPDGSRDTFLLPSFEGVGDTLLGGPGTIDPEEGIGDDVRGDGFGSRPDFGLGCAWCGSLPHKPDCQAISRNWKPFDRAEAERMYGGSSLQTQRKMTEALRKEMDERTRRTFLEGDWEGTTTPLPRTVNAKPKDTRTEVQKRFDAIAEELEESKDGG